MPPEILNSVEAPGEPSVLERSKTERQRHNLLIEDAVQIFDNRISAQQKVITFIDMQSHLMVWVSLLV